MPFTCDAKKEFYVSALAGLTVYSIGIFLVVAISPTDLMDTTHSAMALLYMTFGAVILFTMKMCDQNLIPGLNGIFVPISGMLIALSAKNTAYPELHLVIGVLILVATFLYSLWNIIWYAPQGKHEPFLVPIFLGCFWLLFFAPYLLITFLRW